MKKIFSLLLIATLCAVSLGAAAEANTVTATGSATVTLIPDMATFSIGVTSQDALVTTAQTANNAAMQAIIDALALQGVAQEDMQTEWYSVYPIYDYEGMYPTVTGYEVSNTIVVTVHDLSQIPYLLDAAIEAGANNVYSLSFASSQQLSAYEQALKAAAQDALRKAALIAQAIGRETGDPISLTENGNTSVYYTETSKYSLDSSIATPIENGTVSVTAEVVAVVELK